MGRKASKLEIIERWTDGEEQKSRHITVREPRTVESLMTRFGAGRRVTLLVTPPSARICKIRVFDESGRLIEEKRLLDAEMVFDGTQNAWKSLIDRDLQRTFDSLLKSAPVKTEKLADAFARRVFGHRVP